MRNEPRGSALRFDLLRRFAESERFGLGENVGQKNVVMMAERIQRFVEGNKIAGDEFRSLMDELVEGMLAVSAGLAPVDWAGLIVDLSARQRDVLTVALHGELLEIGREAFQVLLVGKNAGSLGAEKIVVPNGEEAHEHGEILIEGRGAEMLIHLAEAVQHGEEVRGADGDHSGKADRRVHRV